MRLEFPAEARCTRGIALNKDASAWIEFDDCQIVEDEDQIVIINVEMSNQAQELLAAYDDGKCLLYDGDPLIDFPDPDGWGGAAAEIFWATEYRGGLAVAEE